MDPTIISVITIAGTSMAAIAAVATFAYWRGKDMGKAEAEQDHGEAIARLQEHEIDQDRRLDEGTDKFRLIIEGQQTIRAELIKIRTEINGHFNKER